MLFKILHGDKARISTDITPYHEGYCYVTYDGDFYVDMNNERVKLSAKDAETLAGMSLDEIKKSINYNDLINKPTIPTVNNGTLTIQKNGTTVKTFTANSSSNVTANITVPTKVSELTNDSKYLTSYTETDPTVPAWAKEETKPSYNLGEVSDTSSYVRMTPAERTKLSGIATGANKYTHPNTHAASMITGLATVATSGSYNDLSNKPTIPAAVTVDTALSSTSTNPVQNKVINTALGNKVDKVSGKGLSTNDLTAALKTNYDAAYTHSQSAHAPSGAEVNQNAFSNVKVGTITIASDTKTDTIEFAGSNVTITPDATNDKVTFGITKDNVTAALGYTPPTTDTTYSAAGSSLGLVKSGGDVTISSGVITVKDDSHNHTIENVDNLEATLEKIIDTYATKTEIAKLNYTNIAYGTCSTAAGTAAKVITVTGNKNWSLAAGSLVTVLFSATNTAFNPTFNVNGTGAKNVFFGTSQITTSNLSYAGYKSRPMNFMYDGTQYRFIGWGYDGYSNATTTTSNLPGNKLFLVGAKIQSTSGQTTYSNRSAYVGTDNCLYSGGAKVATESYVTSAIASAITTALNTGV